MTRVYPVIPDCEVSEATGVRIVLLIPVVTPGPGPFPLFHIENIVIIRENASLKYRLAHHTAISRNGAVYGVTLTDCKRRGVITICPHPIRRSETVECGFNRTQGCTLEIEPTSPHFTRAGYSGRGQYCVSTLETSFWYNGLQCPILQHEFCFTPRRPVTIGQAHISEVRRRNPESIQTTDKFRDTLREYQEPKQAPIPHLAEVLRELRTRVGHSVKLYHQLQSHIAGLGTEGVGLGPKRKHTSLDPNHLAHHCRHTVTGGSGLAPGGVSLMPSAQETKGQKDHRLLAGDQAPRAHRARVNVTISRDYPKAP
ncbi:hypothetical protein chiPu_0026197 [Chiloscyllium punctatum]|uniref:Uncharacterized protein n=1 Tax=Chiloscyllium punctatum TaxID=137246 RepID=A0A401THW8_CHIPU|nr:hypothetical protein [Chiloscyllium punctatum]